MQVFQLAKNSSILSEVTVVVVACRNRAASGVDNKRVEIRSRWRGCEIKRTIHSRTIIQKSDSCRLQQLERNEAESAESERLR